MSYSAPAITAPLWQQRLRNAWRRTFSRGDIPALLISLGLLWMPALALARAEWSDGLMVLLPIVMVALLTSFLLARSRFSEGGALIFSTFIGFSSIIIIHLMALPGSWSPFARIDQFVARINRWSLEVSSGGRGTENLVFALFLSVLFWYLAHNTVWHIFRLDRVWRAVVPPGLVLVINNIYYRGTNNLEFFLIGFLLFALLLVIHTYVEIREYEWSRNRIRYPVKLRQHFLRIGSIICIVVLLFGWIFPTWQGADNWQKLKEFLGGDPLAQLNELWNRLFSDLEGKGIATTDYYGGDRLDLTGAVQLGDDPVMLVKVSNGPQGVRFYWRSTIFDIYDGSGWNHQRRVRAFKDSEGMTFNAGDYAARQEVSQDIELYIRASSLVYAAPQPIRINDIAVEAELNCVAGGSGCVNSGQESDLSIIRARTPLRADDRYSAVSSISTASADDLRQAGTIYPSWVSQQYLQGTDYVSFRVKDWALQIVNANGALNPYDRAKALETWLRTNISYDESIPAPPLNADPIEWFLFDIQRGYCNYYATAMIMMLRSLGVPARMAAGFAQGTFQAEDDGYLVKENDAHTWVEVYFPGYGWVEFEPTADEDPLDRPGDVTFNSDIPTQTPEPSPTPTQFPTNTLPPVFNTPTSTPTPTDEPDNPLPAMTATPEFQPSQTFAPSPSPTLPVAPEITNIEADNGGGSAFETVVTILTVLVITILLLILLFVLFIWWVEHRGLRGLTTVQKAYARLEIYGRWLRISLHSRQTPYERRRILVDEVPDGEQPINIITHLYAEDRYAPPTTPDYEEYAVNTARRAWRDARLAFIFEKFARWRGQG